MSQQAEDMKVARGKATVDVEQIKYLLWGGKEVWEKHSKLVDIISNDPVFDKSQRPHVTRKERFENGLKVNKRLLELRDEHGWNNQEIAAALAITDEGTSLSLHYIAFTPVIMSQGSEEQVKTIGALANAHGILGAYAQTELGHGTQVSNLETTATYIPDTQEFELHTPRLESMKYWIGALGKFATHCVVQARLILPNGEDKGPHLFLLQIRSLEDHRIFPGITLGDIGPKAFAGTPSNDNGFMRLDHVRVPRTAMLSRFANVTPDGVYKVPVHSKLSYGGMVYIRAAMISQGGWAAAKGATIAIRYATVRRQGGKRGAEIQVINYPSVYHRLLPILARAYTWLFVGREMARLYAAMSAQLAKQATDLLAETHAISSGLKVLVTASTSSDLEMCRRSMGGHGYSVFSGVGTIWANYVPANTFEGENYVLIQQVVRAALKTLHALSTSSNPRQFASSLPPSSFFLRHLVNPPATKDPGYSISYTVLLIELRAAHLLQEHARRLEEHGEDGGAEWRAGRAITESFVAKRVEEVAYQAQQGLDRKTADTISALLRLYLLSVLESGLADILAFDLLPRTPGEDPTRTLRSTTARLEKEILPEAIGLTDAFGFTDYELDSALGVKDGRAYENLFKRAQLDPLNSQDVVDGYKEYIKPILERGQRIVAKEKSKL